MKTLLWAHYVFGTFYQRALGSCRLHPFFDPLNLIFKRQNQLSLKCRSSELVHERLNPNFSKCYHLFDICSFSYLKKHVSFETSMFYIYTGFQSKTAKKGKLSYSLRRTTHAVLLKNRGTLKEQDIFTRTVLVLQLFLR